MITSTTLVIISLRVIILTSSLTVNVNRIRDMGGFDEMKKQEMLADREAVKRIQQQTPGGDKEQIQHSKAPPPVTEKFPVCR